MSITQHLVEDHKDARIIHDKITGKPGLYEHTDENFFFCLLDDGRTAGFSVAVPNGEGRYSLAEMAYLDKYKNQNRSVSLLDYMLFELHEAGVQELLVDLSLLEPGSEVDAFLATKISSDLDGKKLIQTAPKKERWRLFKKRQK